MEEGKEYTIQDFCNLLDLKPSRTKELLKDLTQNIEQIGNNKNRKYKLKYVYSKFPEILRKRNKLIN